MIKKILHISRPRFWFYTFGPYILGSVAASRFLPSDPFFYIYGLYFFIFANIFIYGINDIFDYETDKLNQKKREKELLVQKSFHLPLINTILLTNLPFVLGTLVLPNESMVWFGAFIFLGLFYSAPPLRFKSLPFLDSISNILYAIPGFFAYSLLRDDAISWIIFIAAGCWTAAMHAYSAVPDIEEDSKANISTIATSLGKNKTLLVCAFLFFISGLCMFFYLGWFSIFASMLYLSFCARTIFLKEKSDLLQLYYLFPYINLLVGMGIFFTLLFS